MDADPIYLDHNATTPVASEVVEAMLPYLREHFGNPSSAHVFGQRAHAAVEVAREQVAALLGAQPDEILFTSGGTEANNLAIRGLCAMRSERRHILTSAIEHPATARPCDELECRGMTVDRVSVDGEGRLRLDRFSELLRADTALITVMHANNETGTLQPIERLVELARMQRAVVHTDAAQSVGKVPVHVDELGVDLLSVAGHKLYAPKGVGALYLRRRTPLQPVLLGAGHERGLRPGTENVASIVGLGRACELALRLLVTEEPRQRRLSELLWRGLAQSVPGIARNGPTDERLPNTLNVRFPNCRGSAVLAAADEIAASTGSACHDGGESPSAVLTAMGIPAEAALGSVRLSLGRSTTDSDVQRAVSALVRAYNQVRASKSLGAP
ncbi:MAG: aminotransferase class V-fold PLP-dependent enzyme [Pseudomonadota bacterium]